MRVTNVKNLFRDLTKQYFQGATVVFGNQSRVAKPTLSLVTIATGNVKRPHSPNYATIDGVLVGHYLSRIPMTVDLYTHGAPVLDDNERIVAYEDTALDDILAYADFLNSPYVVQWCRNNDITILIDGDAQNMTGLLNETNYEYRARLSVFVYFTQKAVGTSAILSETAIKYPTGEFDEKGDPVYTTAVPSPTTFTTGNLVDEAVKREKEAIVSAEFEKTPSGGGSEALAYEEAGYFDKYNLKEENEGNE